MGQRFRERDLISEQDLSEIKFWVASENVDISGLTDDEIKDLWIKFSNEHFFAGCMIASESTIIVFADWLKNCENKK